MNQLPVDDLLRELALRALGAVAHTYSDFAGERDYLIEQAARLRAK